MKHNSVHNPHFCKKRMPSGGASKKYARTKANDNMTAALYKNRDELEKVADGRNDAPAQQSKTAIVPRATDTSTRENRDSTQHSDNAVAHADRLRKYDEARTRLAAEEEQRQKCAKECVHVARASEPERRPVKTKVMRQEDLKTDEDYRR